MNLSLQAYFNSENSLTQHEVAQIMGIDPSSISRWVSNKKAIPASRCRKLSEITKIPKELLRADIFSDTKGNTG